MRRESQAVLDSILQELAAIEHAHEMAEARAMFRLLNYCARDRDGAEFLELPSEEK